MAYSVNSPRCTFGPVVKGKQINRKQDDFVFPIAISVFCSDQQSVQFDNPELYVRWQISMPRAVLWLQK